MQNDFYILKQIWNSVPEESKLGAGSCQFYGSCSTTGGGGGASQKEPQSKLLWKYKMY